MRVALLSDTHVPARAESIPEAFRGRITAAPHVIHAGDFRTADVYTGVVGLASEPTAVYGNADPADVGLPAVDSVTLDGVTFVVPHGTENHLRAAVYDDGNVISPKLAGCDRGDGPGPYPVLGRRRDRHRGRRTHAPVPR